MVKKTDQAPPESDPSPLAQHRAKMEARILAAAEQIFIDEGAAGLSMRRLADAVELTPAAIYRYFGSKDDVIQALRNAFFSAFLFRLNEVTRGVEDPREALRVGLRSYIEMGLEKPHHYRAAFTLDTIRRKTPTDAELQEMANQPNLRAFRQLLDGLSETMGSLDKAPTDLETVARSLWASIHGLVLLMINFPHWPRGGREKLITAHVDQIINGIYTR